MVTLNVVAEQIREVDPAAEMEELHAIQLQIADELEIITSATARGIDEIDAEILDEAVAALEQTTALAEDATRLIERFCD